MTFKVNFLIVFHKASFKKTWFPVKSGERMGREKAKIVTGGFFENGESLKKPFSPQMGRESRFVVNNQFVTIRQGRKWGTIPGDF